MRAALVAVVAAVLGASIGACVDVESGETGTYQTPCGRGFRALLLCERESGGADPGGTGSGSGEPSGPATCTSACDIVTACQGGTPADLAECNAECSGEPIPQSLLDCIVENGCNYLVCIPQNSGN